MELNKENLYKMYIIKNKSKTECGKTFNLSHTTISRKLKEFGIVKSPKKARMCRSSIVKNSRAKYEETNLRLYGDKNYNNREKSTYTKKARYGNVSYNNRDKAKKTTQERYSVNNYVESQIFKEKRRETMINKYGAEYTFERPEILLKLKDNAVRNKYEKTMLKRYGVKSPFQSKIFREKTYATKKKNNTFKSSKPEEIIYSKLLKKFQVVERQYNSKLYPYNCDFYIPEKDLYIEYQGMWTHGGEPYVGNKRQLEKVCFWKNKNNQFYNTAIKVWTVYDVTKRNLSKKNNLNWIEFFTLEDFYAWYNSLDERKDKNDGF